MKKKAKVIELPTTKAPAVKNAAWSFYLDRVEEWAYWDNLFSSDECKTIIEIGENKTLHEATVMGVNNGVRDSNVSWLYPADGMEWAFRRVTDSVLSLNERFFKFDLFGMLEGFQFTRYDAPGGKYKRHIDKVLNGSIRKLSLSIQLSESSEYEGGDLLIHNADTPVRVEKKQGYMAVFPSYTLHEVEPVTKGTRYSLVAWITGPQFK